MQEQEMMRLRREPPRGNDNRNNNEDKDGGNGTGDAINPLNRKSRRRNGVCSHRCCHSHGHYDKRFVAVTKMASLKEKFLLQWKSLRWRTRCLWATVALIFCLNIVISIIDSSFRSYGTATSVKMTGAATHEDTFSVVINTYKRPQMLKRAVRHYAETCGRSVGVARVYIIWADLAESPPDPNSFFDMTTANNDNKNERPQPALQQLKGNAISGEDNGNSESSSRRRPSTVQIVRAAKDSLNSRFLPLPPQQSNSSGAIFMVDDDVLVDCFSVQQAFYAWKSRPTAMAGFYPRLAAPAWKQQHQSESSSKLVKLVYHAWPVVFWRQQMNFVLTKAAFFHERYLDLYTADTHPQAIKDYVDTNRNCEDVAMAMLIANITKAEAGHAATGQNALAAPTTSIAAGMPIYIQGKVTDLGLFNGISTGNGHMKKRSDCLNDLSRIYQQAGWSAPLGVSNNAAAGDDQKQPVYYNLEEASWVHHSPGFWWQLRPSNIFEWFA